MGGLDATVTIPGLMISQHRWQRIALRTAGVTVTLDAMLNPTLDDQIATFSSRGPGHGGSTFKPDLSAPGVAIVSAGVGTGTGSREPAGHVDGVAARGRRRRAAAAVHPKLDQAAIKALLQNSTVLQRKR